MKPDEVVRQVRLPSTGDEFKIVLSNLILTLENRELYLGTSFLTLKVMSLRWCRSSRERGEIALTFDQANKYDGYLVWKEEAYLFWVWQVNGHCQTNIIWTAFCSRVISRQLFDPRSHNLIWRLLAINERCWSIFMSTWTVNVCTNGTIAAHVLKSALT
jgi:hypothetical protein